MHVPSPSAPFTRRQFLRVGSAAVAIYGLLPASTQAATTSPPRPGYEPITTVPPGVPTAITVYKDPSCGCCKEWVKHIRAAGFVATVHDTEDMATVKSSMGVPDSLQSCHTARVGNYVIEGHVPADVMIKLLKEKPPALGLAVPGMPSGSPGMEGGRVDRYDVMLFDKSGKARIYASR